MPLLGLPYDDAQIFQTVNLCLPAWILLGVAPRWRFTQPIATGTALAFAALYTWLAVTQITTNNMRDLDMTTLDGVSQMLSTKDVVLPAWVHYVVFDLFTAKWQVRLICQSALFAGFTVAESTNYSATPCAGCRCSQPWCATASSGPMLAGYPFDGAGGTTTVFHHQNSSDVGHKIQDPIISCQGTGLCGCQSPIEQRQILSVSGACKFV